MSRGSVYKYDTASGRRWGFVVDVPGDNRRQKRRTGYPTRKTAEAALAEWQGRFVGYYTGGSVTLNEYADTWLVTVARTKAPNTHRMYAQNLRLYLLPTLGHRTLDDVTPMDLDRLYAELGGRLASGTVLLVHRTASKLWNDAIRKGVASRNPATHADKPSPRKERKPPKVWTATQLGVFLDGVGGRRDYPMWHVAEYTGMRLGELAGLTWGAFNGERLSVHQQWTDDGMQPTKGHRFRTVTLDAVTLGVVRRWRTRLLEDAMEWGWRLDDSTRMFVDELGAPYSRWHWSSLPALTPEGLPRITLHGLRHTHATLLLSAGVHPKKVAERLGHASIGLTLDVYSHVTPEMDADVASVFAGVLSQIVTGIGSDGVPRVPAGSPQQDEIPRITGVSDPSGPVGG